MAFVCVFVARPSLMPSKMLTFVEPCRSRDRLGGGGAIKKQTYCVFGPKKFDQNTPLSPSPRSPLFHRLQSPCLRKVDLRCLGGVLVRGLLRVTGVLIVPRPW